MVLAVMVRTKQEEIDMQLGGHNLAADSIPFDPLTDTASSLGSSLVAS